MAFLKTSIINVNFIVNMIMQKFNLDCKNGKKYAGRKTPVSCVIRGFILMNNEY